MLENTFAKEPALLIPIVMYVGATLVFVVWIVASYWKRAAPA